MEREFKDILGKVMKERRITQYALSLQMGIRQSQVSNWLNGKSAPGYRSIKLLCEALELSADFLLGFTDEER